MSSSTDSEEHEPEPWEQNYHTPKRTASHLGAAAESEADQLAVTAMLSAMRSKEKHVLCPAAYCDLTTTFKTPTSEDPDGSVRALNIMNHALEVIRQDPHDDQHNTLVRVLHLCLC